MRAAGRAPLAIELAAARLRHLSLQELIDRLDDRLTLLVGGRPKAGQRHSALTATIEWSHRLLSDDARSLFDRLGVFPASFDLDAVQAVAGELDPGQVTNLLGDLVAKSLVVHDPAEHRYRLLETLRLFAARRLDDLENARGHRAASPARRRALPDDALVRTCCPPPRPPEPGRPGERPPGFEASLERGDLTAAVDVALGISTLWRNAVSYTEGRRWVAALRPGTSRLRTGCGR